MVINLDYVIKDNKNNYIKLDKNGSPITCNETEKMQFEFSKAKNIIAHLPKILRQFHFQIVAIPDIAPVANKEVVNIIKENVLVNKDYELSENVSRWIDKFGNCYDVLTEAKQILKSLKEQLCDADKELLDILHIIELEPPKDLYGGWKIYKRIKENRKKRRITKDEICIIENVLEKIDPTCLQREEIQKAIDGLFNRKYKFRIVEDGEEDGV